ncbi:MAG: hypothetical protein ACI4EW_00435 [Butyrivibrio sp.]
MDIFIIVLMGILIISQIYLAIRQIKKGAPDGRILLIIDIAVLVIFTPLSVIKLITGIKAVKIAWYVTALVYMIFTIWYTNMLSRTMKK